MSQILYDPTGETESSMRTRRWPPDEPYGQDCDAVRYREGAFPRVSQLPGRYPKGQGTDHSTGSKAN